ncbi:MAG: hypothetical protein JG718_15660 [Candidatus Thiothrix moscowensis]|nr:hypothetical protein [Candidatus Thiothrix moscowensis]
MKTTGSLLVGIAGMVVASSVAAANVWNGSPFGGMSPFSGFGSPFGLGASPFGGSPFGGSPFGFSPFMSPYSMMNPWGGSGLPMPGGWNRGGLPWAGGGLSPWSSGLASRSGMMPFSGASAYPFGGMGSPYSVYGISPYGGMPAYGAYNPGLISSPYALPYTVAPMPGMLPVMPLGY